MKPLCTFSLVLLLASVPAAFAQTGAAGAGRSGMSAGTPASAREDPSFQSRMGRGQRPTELVQTTLLNRFGGLGFHRIVDIRRQGDNYMATVETVRGNNVVLEIDADTGQIVSETPVAPAGTEAAGTAAGMAGGAAGTMQGRQMAGASCGPADWNPLEQAIGRLPADRAPAARRMLVDVYDLHAANDMVGCRGRVEDLRSYLRGNGVLP